MGKYLAQSSDSVNINFLIFSELELLGGAHKYTFWLRSTSLRRKSQTMSVGPEDKYFRLYWPYDLCCDWLYSAVGVWC